VDLGERIDRPTSTPSRQCLSRRRRRARRRAAHPVQPDDQHDVSDRRCRVGERHGSSGATTDITSAIDLPCAIACLTTPGPVTHCTWPRDLLQVGSRQAQAECVRTTCCAARTFGPVFVLPLTRSRMYSPLLQCVPGCARVCLRSAQASSAVPHAGRTAARGCPRLANCKSSVPSGWAAVPVGCSRRTARACRAGRRHSASAASSVSSRALG
jgi:hypothetical protein